MYPQAQQNKHGLGLCTPFTPRDNALCSHVFHVFDRHIAHTSSSPHARHAPHEHSHLHARHAPHEHTHTCLIKSMGRPTIPHTNSSIKSNNMDARSTCAKRTSPSTPAFQDAWSQVQSRFTFTHFMASASTPTQGRFRTQKHKTHSN